NSSIHIDENQKRLHQLITAFQNQCEEISCFVGEKQFFINREENLNLNEAELYIKTATTKELDKLLNKLKQYIRSAYPEARLETQRVKNLFEQLFHEETAPLIANFSAGQNTSLPIDTINR
ncbi:MAG: hypothetical protein K2L23_05385, partial [Odoribacter sp.]|nr:hypothetical protein [Odoribacter sp.]